eukprot:PhM_4_TR12265/c0_g1_i1/m.52983
MSHPTTGMYHLEFELEGAEAVNVMKPSLWHPGTYVKTYFVVPKPRKGCFTSLSDAIAYADPYSRIEIASGRYFENIVITKPLEIGPEKGDEDAELRSHGVTLTVDVDEAYFSGIRVHTNEASSYAVQIESGSPTFSSCILESVSVINYATPVLEDNRVCGSKVNGIFVTHRAGGIYRQNSIENHSWFCVWVESTGSPEFAHNKMTKGDLGQIRVMGLSASSEAEKEQTSDKVEPSFKFNRVIDDAKRVLVRPNTAPVHERPVRMTGDTCLLLAHQGRRLHAAQNGYSFDSFEDDYTYTTAHSGHGVSHAFRYAVVVSHKANPSFSRNTILDGLNSGFHFTDGARGTVEYCSVYNNQGWGFVLEKNSMCTISRNFMHGNGAGGIKVIGSGGAINYNDIYDNRGCAIDVCGTCPRLTGMHNNIHGTNPVGLWFSDGGGGHFYENEIHEASECGIRVDTAANPLIEKNQVRGCVCGVLVTDKGKGIFTRNDLSNNNNCNVTVSNGAAPVMSSNRMSSSVQGLCVSNAAGEYYYNFIRENRIVQVHVSGCKSRPKIEGNLIEAARDAGVVLTGRSQASLISNAILRSGGVQVLIEDHSDAYLYSNLIEKGAMTGVVITTGSCPTLVENTVRFCRGDGVQVSLEADPTLRANLFDRNALVGVRYMHRGGGTCEKNTFHANVIGNIFVVPTHPESEDEQNKHNRITPTNNTNSKQQTNNKVSGKKPNSTYPFHTSPPATRSPFSEHSKTKKQTTFVPTELRILKNWILSSTTGLSSGSRNVELHIERNSFSYNDVSLSVSGSSKPVVFCNEFDLSEDGISIADASGGSILCNTFENVKQGVVVRSDSAPSIHWNMFISCGVGVMSLAGGGAVFDNVFRDCKSHAVQLGCAATTNVFSNFFAENESAVAAMEGCTTSIVASNTLYANSNGVSIIGRTTCKVHCNLIVKQGNGIVVGHHGTGVFALNAVIASTKSQILVESEGDPFFDSGMLVGPGINGIEIRNKGCGTFANLSICGREIGLRISREGNPTITGCTFQKNGTGILVIDGGVGNVSSCLFNENNVNIHLKKCGECTFTRCALSHAEKGVVSEGRDTTGTLTLCTLGHHRTVGVEYLDGAQTRFFRCFLHQHEDEVVTARDCWGTMERCTFTNNEGYSFVGEAGAGTEVLNCVFVYNRSIAVVQREGSRCRFIGNHFSNNQIGHVHVMGEGATPMFESNVIDGSPGYGFLLEDHAAATLRKNSIKHCIGDGICVRSYADPMVVENEVSQCRHAGVFVYDCARGTFTNNRIAVNLGVGVWITNVGTEPTLYQNDIVQSGSFGILVDNEATPTIRDNDIHENGIANVAVKTKARPLVQRNRIYSGNGYGVDVAEESGGEYDSNIIHVNKLGGMHITKRSVPIVVNNVIHHEKEGILIEYCSGKYSGNVLRSCVTHAMFVRSADPEIEKNLFESCTVGLTLTHGADAKVHNNWFRSSRSCSLCSEHTSEGIVYRNVFEGGNSGDLVVMRDGARTKVDSNYIIGGVNGISVLSDATPVLVSNVVCQCLMNGIALRCSGKAALKDNLVVSCGQSNVLITDRSDAYLDHNMIIEGKVGIMVSEGSNPRIVSTDVAASTVAGIRVESHSMPTIERCSVHDSRGSGISDAASATITNCMLWTNHIGIEGDARSSGKIIGVEVRDCGNGIVLGDECSAALLDSTIGTCRSVNVTYGSGCLSEMTGNNIFRSKIGILCQEGCSGIIKANNVYWNIDNIVIHGNCHVMENNVYDAANVGILIKGGGSRVHHNLAFDNFSYSLRVEHATSETVVIDNKLYFARDEGALSVDLGATAKVVNNSVKNLDTANWPQSTTTRNVSYNNFSKEDKAAQTQIKAQKRIRDRAAKHLKSADLLVEELMESIFESRTRIDARRPSQRRGEDNVPPNKHDTKNGGDGENDDHLFNDMSMSTSTLRHIEETRVEACSPPERTINVPGIMMSFGLSRGERRPSTATATSIAASGSGSGSASGGARQDSASRSRINNNNNNNNNNNASSVLSRKESELSSFGAGSRTNSFSNREVGKQSPPVSPKSTLQKKPSRRRIFSIVASSLSSSVTSPKEGSKKTKQFGTNGSKLKKPKAPPPPPLTSGTDRRRGRRPTTSGGAGRRSLVKFPPVDVASSSNNNNNNNSNNLFASGLSSSSVTQQLHQQQQRPAPPSSANTSRRGNRRASIVTPDEEV